MCLLLCLLCHCKPIICAMYVTERAKQRFFFCSAQSFFMFCHEQYMFKPNSNLFIAVVSKWNPGLAVIFLPSVTNFISHLKSKLFEPCRKLSTLLRKAWLAILLPVRQTNIIVFRQVIKLLIDNPRQVQWG